MSLKTIRTFDDSIQANLVKTKLESEGLICFLFDEHSVSINPLYINTLGGIKLKIRTDDIEVAEGIIQEMESKLTIDRDGDVLSCPNCGSKDLYHDFKSYGVFEWVITVVIALIGVIFPFLYKTVYKCKDCDNEFKNE